MTILCFEEFPDSSSLQWVAVRADPAFKTTPGKESLVICFKNGHVYEYSGMKDGGNFSPKETFEIMKNLKVSPKMGTRKSPGAYFASIKQLLRLYKSHGNFASFDTFHAAKYGKAWKTDVSPVFPVLPVRNWVGRLVGW